MIITVRTSYIPLEQSEHSLVNPFTGSKEPMTMIIYQEEIDSGVLFRVTNRLSCTFYGADSVQIPASRWTAEMKAVFKEQKRGVTKRPTSTKILFYGWVLIALIIIPTIGLAYNGYRDMVKNNNRKALMHEAKNNPLVNDLYFGGYSITPEEGPIRTGYAWIKVVEVAGDSISIQLSTDNGYKNEVLPKNYNSSIFEPTIYRVGGDLEHGLLQFSSKNSDITFLFMDSK